MRHLIQRARADEHGFTLVIGILVLFIVMLFSVAALGAAGGDVRHGGYSRDQKKAFNAAEAGLQWYQAQLGADPTYWTKCKNVAIPQGETAAPVNDLWNGTGTDPRTWRQISGSNQWYTVELVPANSKPACVQGDDTTFVDDTTKTFRLRVSGSAGQPTPTCGQACPPRRSIIATFRRSSFLDYLYFTDVETYDPALQLAAAGYSGGTSAPNFATWARTNCAKHWWQGRGDATNVQTTNVVHKGTNYNGLNLGCQELAFGNDTVAGPLHTNDSILLCGNSPGTTFGRNAQDAIEMANGNPDASAGGPPTGGYPSTRNCPITPTPVATWTGTKNQTATSLQMPSSNSTLASAAGGVGTTYRPAGRTTIQLMGATNQVKINGVTRAWPTNGVIYIDNNGACAGYDPANPQGSSTNCGDAHVYGTYNQPLTIGAANDVVVTDDITNLSPGATSTSMLGLIANNFVRVWHPVSNQPTVYRAAGSPYYGRCQSTDTAGNLGDERIDAAILALNDSFMVDAQDCGNASNLPQGTLTVNGAIVQKFRGAVGYASGGTVVAGYNKNYNYDDRFHLRNPPFFLDPTAAAWNLVRVTQQQPAT
jgi:Tfp pilus assembly protein PilX